MSEAEKGRTGSVSPAPGGGGTISLLGGVVAGLALAYLAFSFASGGPKPAPQPKPVAQPPTRIDVKPEAAQTVTAPADKATPAPAQPPASPPAMPSSGPGSPAPAAQPAAPQQTAVAPAASPPTAVAPAHVPPPSPPPAAADAATAQAAAPQASAPAAGETGPIAPVDEPDFVAGTSPAERPAGAPTITTVTRAEQWYQRALTGVAPPYPSSLRFLEDQGEWYTPFNHPGMTGPYDIRRWHDR